MEGSADTLEVEREHDDDDLIRRTTPASVRQAAAGAPETAAVEMDATAWLLESDVPTRDEVEPQEIILNVGTSDAPKKIKWFVVPIPDEEFRKARRAALPRAQRRGQQMPGVADLDETKYHSIIVAAATVEPNLSEVGARKGVADTAAIVRHRFAHKPGLIAQISGVVSDISGFDEADLEVVAKNS